MGKYSVRGWQYWPDRREGQYRTRELNISPYCPTLGTAIIYLLYDSTFGQKKKKSYTKVRAIEKKKFKKKKIL